MKINKITLSEGCFGPDIEINEESLFHSEYDKRTEEEIREYKIALINELFKVVDKINIIDLRTLGEIVTINSDEYEFIEELSDESSCDQCGNWNYYNTFIKKLDE